MVSRKIMFDLAKVDAERLAFIKAIYIRYIVVYL